MPTRPVKPCCDSYELDRRHFLRAAGGTAAIGMAGGLLGSGSSALAAPTPESAAEQVIKAFYETITPSQRELICLPIEDERRLRVSANWHITDRMLGEQFFTVEQRGLVREIIKNLTSEEGFEQFIRQMDDDAGGLDYFSVAVFGTPGEGPFEWALTGRHLTLRADGNTMAGAAFGGPMVYGHGEEDAEKNMYHFQTVQVNEVFAALDEPQRREALLSRAPRENEVQIQGRRGSFPGIRVGDLTTDQQELVSVTLKTLLAPYRTDDVEEVMTILREHGDLAELRMAFYEQGDLNNDQKWDIWRIEGPAFVWHFRGAPHVHAYINIGTPTA